MKIGQIGITLDDLPGVWRIEYVGYSMLLLISIDDKHVKSVSPDNFWVLL